MRTVTELGPRLGIAPTCAALEVARASYYRGLKPQVELPPRPTPAPPSLRAASDQVDVSAVARKENGGGHRQAAGFSTRKSSDELIEFLRAEIASQLEANLGSGASA